MNEVIQAMKKVFLVVTALFWISMPVQADIIITGSTTYQTIDGFSQGEGYGTMTQAAVAIIHDPVTGLGFSQMTLQIEDDQTIRTALKKAAQLAQAYGVKVWLETATPPAAWKDNGSLVGGHLLSAHYADFAASQAQVVLDLVNNYGIPASSIISINVQNEPDYPANYSSCRWTAQELHDFVPYLRSALNAAGLTTVKVQIPDTSAWSTDLAAIAMNDSAVAAQVGIIAAHTYNVAQPGPLESWGKPLWAAEDSDFQSSYSSNITGGLAWATKIYYALTSAQVSMWRYLQGWNEVGDTTNQALSDGSGTYTTAHLAKRAFTHGNYCKFIRPGWVRIGVTNSTGLLISAFRDSSSNNLAIVIVNNGSASSQTFSLLGFDTISSVTPWITSSSLSLAQQTAVAISSNSFSYTIPASSVVSFVGVANVPSPPPTTTYVLSTYVTGQGTITLNPSGGIYNAGSVVTVTAVPSAGWKFDHWEGDASGSNNLVTITMNSNKSITAVFIQPNPGPGPYTLNISVNGGHGTISAPDYPAGTRETATAISDLGPYPQDVEVNVVAKPDQGYQVKAWTGTDNDAAKENLNRVIMNANRTVTVEFEPVSNAKENKSGGGGGGCFISTTASDGPTT